MNKGGRFAGFELVHLLFLVAAAELAFNRLATEELRPTMEGATPPWWHQALDHFGLFCQYFASTLAIGIIAYQLWRMIVRRDVYWSGARYALAATSVPFLFLGALGLFTVLGVDASFWLETGFMAMALCLLAGQLTRGGDLGVKIGLILLITPLAVHYYGVFSFRYLAGEEALWSDLPERVLQYGQWTLVVAALLSPYCFAPRPLLQSMVRPGPLVVATFVSVIGVVLLRQYYEVAMRLGENWLGLDIGPGAPMSSLFTYAFALGTMTWTLTACVSADSVARRDIGMGIGLVVISGYGFVWPVQFLVSMTGLMTIGQAATKVAAEESLSADRAPAFRAPPIASTVWQDYVRELAAALGASRPAASVASAPPESPATSATMNQDADLEGQESQDSGAEPAPSVSAPIVIVHGDHSEHTITHIASTRHGLDVTVRIERRGESLATVDVTCGSVPKGEIEPQWVMFARPERLLGVGIHPDPPATSAPVRRFEDDVAFDQRFRVRDSDDHTGALFDEALRASATALIDGWVALWPGHGLRYRVHPGHGAPLDHPIPITELAFRGAATAAHVARLLAVIDLLSSMAARALLPRS